MRSGTKIFKYNGYEMRSHSETRWAAMMDALGITWIYEPKVVETRHGWYLPDFYLPAAGLFVEVKGPGPTQIELEKAADAQEQTGCPVVFAYGKPEMLWGQLYHGMVSYFGSTGAVSYSTVEIGAMVREHMGLHKYAAYMASGEHQARPNFISVSDVMNEVISGWQDRNGREESLRRVHDPLNAERLAVVGQSSRVEWALSQIAARIKTPARQLEAA